MAQKILKISATQTVQTGTDLEGEGGGGGMTNVTYAQLVAMIDAEQLTPGATYCITDFATTHYIFNGGTALNDINTGTVEALIVTAIDNNALNRVAYSQNYPQDILHYDAIAANWLKDPAFAKANTIITGFKGVIFSREDTKNRNVLGYDFRAVKCRRYALNAPVWSDATTYAARDIVQEGTRIYVGIKASTNKSPIAEAEYWAMIADVAQTNYLAQSSTEANGIAVNAADFVDVLTFAETGGTNTYELCVLNNTFAKYTDDTSDYKYNGYTASILPNNVFYLTNSGYQEVAKNAISTYFELNTVVGRFESVTVGSGANKNIMSGVMYSTIGHAFNRNNISYMANTTIGNNVYQNKIASFASVVVLNAVNGNIFGAQTQYTLIKSGVATSIFRPGMQQCTIEDDVQNADVSASTICNQAFAKTYFNAQSGKAVKYVNGSNVLTISGTL